MSFMQETATRYGAVTKSDTTVLQFKALYIGGAGSVVLKEAGSGGDAITFAAVPVGTTLLVSGTRVMAASTATNIVWLDW
jgi:hypothetical protein